MGPGYNSSRYIFRLSQRLASRLWRSTGIRGSTHFYYIWKCSFFVSDKQSGLHKLWHPSIRDTSMWSKFVAHGGFYLRMYNIYNIAFNIDVVCNGAGNASANPLKRVRGLGEGPTTAA